MSRKAKIRSVHDTSGICPGCLRPLDDHVDRHHVIAYMDGGVGRRWNVLPLCRSCHALITHGRALDRLLYSGLCLRYIVGTYGLLPTLQTKDDETLRRMVRINVEPGSPLSAYKTFSSLLKNMFSAEYCKLMDVRNLGDEAVKGYFLTYYSWEPAYLDALLANDGDEEAALEDMP